MPATTEKHTDGWCFANLYADTVVKTVVYYIIPSGDEDATSPIE